MTAIPNLSKLTLIPTGVGEPKKANVMVGGTSPFAELPPELGALIAQKLIESYDGPREVCKGLGAMLSTPGWQNWHPIGQLLGEQARIILTDEDLWRLAFLKCFGLEPDPMEDDDEETTPPDQDLLLGRTWAQLFHKVCKEIELFDQAQTPESRIALDWKNNANWTPHEVDSMLFWLQEMQPKDDVGGNGQFYATNLKLVLRTRGGNLSNYDQRILDSSYIYELLVTHWGSAEFLEMVEREPKPDVDMSPPVIIGSLQPWSPKPYHRIITSLTSLMVHSGVTSTEAIEISHYKRVMQILIQTMRASPNVPSSKNNYVPLCVAIDHGDHAAVIEMLIELGASTDPEIGSQWTPLMFACGFGDRLSCVEALLKGEANVNASRGDGWTPLAIACAHCKSVELVRKLLVAGAYAAPHTRSPHGRDPSHPEYRKNPWPLIRHLESLKSEENMTQIAALLRDYGASQ
jgi:hypothetical protein